MSNSSVPFYTQAAILDRYIHSSDPGADPETLEVILEMLRSREDLRDYFFRSRPHAAWASILWDNGFFDDPPPPQEAEGGYVLPRWDVQEYLISVARQVPEIVVKHVEFIQGPGWYISRAIRALCFIPTGEAEPVVPRIVEWLKDTPIASAIASETCELIVKLAHEGRSAAAFSLFRELTAPVPPPAAEDRRRLVLGGGEAACKFRGHWDEDQILSGALEAVRNLDVQQVVAILEDHLCTALRVEAIAVNSPRLEFASWWRTAIEDTDQDPGRSYKHKLLVALRDALEDWVRQDAVAVGTLLHRYLSDEREILRRMGLHILHRFPAEYQAYVTAELQNAGNLDATGIHHEFFLLLQRGYPWLKSPDREALIAAICSGPPPERVEKWAKWLQEAQITDTDEHIERYSKQWIRDRLWMPREHLTGPPKELLDDLVAELGEPEHPSFTRWSTGVSWVQDVSPIAEEEISQLSPDELVAFLERWQPSADQWPGPERISYEGLARTVASVVTANSEKYADHLVAIALLHPEYARALLDPFARGEEADLLPWELSISLCEGLLASDTVREDVSQAVDGSWIGVRQSIVRLLRPGLNNPQHAIPSECLRRVRDILLVLVDDPDPEPESESPPEDWLGHNDPATVALNRVRPSALLALIECARFRAQLIEKAAQDVTPKGPGPKRLEAVVRETLTRKLDRREDPSWAVHSVYGHYLLLLYWLDQEWVESHIDQIFPEDTDEQSIWYYIAAWDSFVAFNGFYQNMLEMLRSKYERAIDNLIKGYVTQTNLGPERHLPLHLAGEYVLSDYELRSPEGQSSLIAMFFKQASPEARGSGAWALWRICEGSPSKLETYWPRVRAMWEWRTHEASTASHTTDFDEEMTWFAHLLDVVPEWETMASLWPLLEGLLPHIARSEHPGIGWNSVEKYLSIEVDRDPVRAIQFYRLMHEQLTRPLQLYRGQEARKIIETAATYRDSQHEALSLIDLIARSGDHQYQDIYDRHAG